eukprot:gene957-273_t
MENIYPFLASRYLQCSSDVPLLQSKPMGVGGGDEVVIDSIYTPDHPSLNASQYTCVKCDVLIELETQHVLCIPRQSRRRQQLAFSHS